MPVVESASWLLLDEKMPTSSAHIGAASAHQHGLIFVVGDNGLCHAFSPQWRTWTALPAMNEERHACGVVFLNDKLFAIGGFGCGTGIMASVERLRISAEGQPRGEWIRMPELKQIRYACGVAVFGAKKLIVALGGGGENSPFSSVETFHTETHKQERLPNMAKRWGCAAVAVNDRIFVFGGKDKSSRLRLAESYDLETGKWTQLPPMSRERSFPAAVLIDNFIVVVGGRGKDNEYHQDVEVFDINEMNWQMNHNIPKLGTSRWKHGAAFLNGALYVFGGQNSSVLLDSIEMLEIHALNRPQPKLDQKTDLQQSPRTPIGGDGPQPILSPRWCQQHCNNNNRSASIDQNRNASNGEEVHLLSRGKFGRAAGTNNNKRRRLPEQLQNEERVAAGNKEQEASAKLPTIQTNGPPQPHQQTPLLPRFLLTDHSSKADELVFDKHTRATKLLACHGQAKVYFGCCQHDDGREEVAIKVFGHGDLKEWDGELRNLLRPPTHPNIIEVLKFFQYPMPAIVMRYIEGGNLLDHINTRRAFIQENAKGLLVEVGEGLEHLHKHSVIHRDLKPQNILMEALDGDNRMRPILIDLGSGKIMEGCSHAITAGVRGTSGYMAPEMMSQCIWSRKTDMYSLGIVMWEILAGQEAFRGLTYSRISSGVAAGERPDVKLLDEAVASQGQKDLMAALWSKNPADRPSAEQFVREMRTE